MLHTSHMNGRLLRVLNRHEVEYLVVGGLAVKYYWPQREVDDLDLLIDPTTENKDRLIRALREMAISRVDYIEERLHNPSTCPQQIPLHDTLNADILTPHIGRFCYSSALPNAVRTMVDDIHVKIISCRDLIDIKKLRSERKDLRDIQVLEKVCKELEISS